QRAISLQPMSTLSAPPQSTARRRVARIWWSSGLLVLLGLVLYGHGLDAPFIFDGDLTLLEHPALHRPWPLGEMPFWNRCCGAWTFQWNFWLGGPRPRWYHLVNNLIHVGCALIVFDLVRRSL